MIEYFAVACTRLEERLVQPINDLNPDFVQIPLHVKQPPPGLIDKINDVDTDVIGKWVTPQNFHSFDRQFFQRLTQKYKGRIKIWDFGGEPETAKEQPGCRWFGTPKQFVEQLKMFRDVVKSSDPEATIGSGGFITPTFNGFYGNEDRSKFLFEAYDAGLDELIDFISINAYIYGYGGTKNVVAGIGRVKEIMAWFHSKKPIVIAETGVPVAGDPKYLHIIQTPERQANSILESHVLFHSVGVDWIVWFQLCEECWGLMSEKGEKRKGFKAYNTMVEMLKGCEYTIRYKAFPSRTVEERWLTDKIEWHVFEKGEDEVHVIWVTGGKGVTAKVSKPMKVFDVLGEEKELGKEITITDPIYLIAKKGVVTNQTFMVV